MSEYFCPKCGASCRRSDHKCELESDMKLSYEDQGLLRYALRMAHEHTTNVPIRGELAAMYERIAGQPLSEPIRVPFGWDKECAPLDWRVNQNVPPNDDDIETYIGSFTYGFRKFRGGAP